MPEAIQGSLGAHALGVGVTAGQGVTIGVVLTFVLVFVVFAPRSTRGAWPSWRTTWWECR